ncbi:MAG: hypothetical protein ABIQ40_03835 [Bacteroidia bacterium]
MSLESTNEAFNGILTEECDNIESNIFIAGKHSISQPDYEEMISDFFGNITTPCHVRTASSLDVTGSCVTNYIGFVFGHFKPDNGDILVAVVNGPIPTTELYPVIGKYSIHLFRALKYLYPGSEFHFSKARTIFMKRIVVTLTVKVVIGTTVKYYGDLTNMYP